jgi:regulatory protein
MEKEESAAELYQRSLRYLSRREHSRRELSQKLSAHCSERQTVQDILNRLEQEGYQSEQRAAEAIVRAHEGRHGSERIRLELLRRGIADDLIETLLDSPRDQDVANARELWQRKFNVLPGTPQERAKQWRYLQNRGFSLAVIRQILKGASD